MIPGKHSRVKGAAATLRRLFVGLALCLLAIPPVTALAQDSERILVFSRAAGFRHESIPAGIDALEAVGRSLDVDVDHSEDPAVFSGATLSSYAAVVFLNTTGDVLDPRQQAALTQWHRAGGAWLGIHAAADTEYDWSWYGGLVGAWFASHGDVQAAIVQVRDADHPATAALGAPTWQRVDEWYDFRAQPRRELHVLLALDEGSYRGGKMGREHPIAWCGLYQGGRTFYTGLGHTAESYEEDAFRAHLRGALEWLLGRSAATACDQR